MICTSFKHNAKLKQACEALVGETQCRTSPAPDLMDEQANSSRASQRLPQLPKFRPQHAQPDSYLEDLVLLPI